MLLNTKRKLLISQLLQRKNST